MIYHNRLTQAFREIANAQADGPPSLMTQAQEYADGLEHDELMRAADALEKLAVDPAMTAILGGPLCRLYCGAAADWLVGKAIARE
jgi:hypothetical protein